MNNHSWFFHRSLQRGLRESFFYFISTEFWLRVSINIYEERMFDNEPNGASLRRVLTYTKEATDKAKEE